MDLRAATWPVGVLDVPVGSNRVDGRGAALAATGLHAGAAFGDAIERSLSGREIAAFDTLGAPFWFDLGDFTAARGGPRHDGRGSRLHGAAVHRTGTGQRRG